MRPHLVPGLVVLLATLALSGCGGGDFQEIEIPTGYRGKARVNPFLAAERFLNEMGLEAEQHSALTELPPYEVALFLPAETVQTAQTASRIRQWVEEGGHLIYLHRGGDSLLNDFAAEVLEQIKEARQSDAEDEENKPKTGVPKEKAEPKEEKNADKGDKDSDEDEMTAEEKREAFREEHPMLAELEIQIGNRNSLTTSVQIDKEKLGVRIPAGDGFKLPRWVESEVYTFLAGPPRARSFASYPLENGRVTLLANGSPWRNRYIGEEDHATLLWEVLQLQLEPVGVWLMRGTSVSFFQLLTKYGWMPLLSLAVFIVAWLWFAIPRFGPLLPPDDDSQREFTEHLSMTGNFLWQRRCVDSLLDPVRHRILRRWHRTHLLDTEGVSPEIIHALAETTGLSAQRVQDAMQVRKPRDANQLILLLRDLQKLDQAQ